MSKQWALTLRFRGDATYRRGSRTFCLLRLLLTWTSRTLVLLWRFTFNHSLRISDSQGSQPRFYWARQVSYAIRDVLLLEIEHQVKLGILETMNFFIVRYTCRSYLERRTVLFAFEDIIKSQWTTRLSLKLIRCQELMICYHHLRVECFLKTGSLAHLSTGCYWWKCKAVSHNQYAPYVLR